MLLRHGLKVRGFELRLYYSKPRSAESAAATKHGENPITFRQHFYFGETNQETDFVFFLNGLPIVALELKHEKNQTVHDAVAQFAGRDRPDGESVASAMHGDGANEILNIRIVSIGLIDRSPVHPREVFADALADRASAVIVAHNHPSGGVEPSQSDINITAQLKAAGEIVGIEPLDHVIFNRTEYFSFLENGKL